MKKDVFLTGLKVQFEESDAMKLTMETKFNELDTWDSLTRFSIIAFLEDDYKVILKKEDLDKLETPLAIFNCVNEVEANLNKI
ncbi:Acyl carrier protein [Flavobacterium psychrophilum]|uniref:acyl carrier protein n=1 Tax=Flavobacterium psychrophilum TaxID=96345 RepID=UPI000B7C5080|nr:acyl carrier protein [Flavobacterium psychrophilum]SNB43404.1 Acyl carrier protein [Flavobacterium psychrophilum]